MNDDTDEYASGATLEGVGSLAPGHSAVFIEGTGATAEAFEAFWFGSSVPAGFQIGHYSGSGVGLSGGGDGVNVFNAEGDRITGVAYSSSTDDVSFDNAAGLGSYTAPVTISTLSVEGVNGAFVAHDQLGSPGRVAAPPAPPAVKVTEVAPWGGGASYDGDWFELTNTGSTGVDLSGWRMNDDTNEFASGAQLEGVGSLEPGESAVFIEGDSTNAEAFEAFWFGASVPSGFKIGYYSGSGVGLGGGGDAVTIFDAAGERITGVAYGSSTDDVTFDNSAGLGSSGETPATISTLSAVGVNGAFAAGGEIGSPGTIANGPVGPLLATDTPAFPDQPVWTIGPGQWVTATNSGDADVTIGGVAVDAADAGSEGDFLVTSDHCTGATLAPAESCKVQIRFAPGRENATSSASLAIASNVPGGPTLVPLIGEQHRAARRPRRSGGPVRKARRVRKAPKARPASSPAASTATAGR